MAEATSGDQRTAPLGRAATVGSVWLFSINLATRATQVLVTVALALFLTPGQLGLVAVTTVIVNLGQALQSMGVYEVISRTRREPLGFGGSVATLSVGVGFGLSAAFLATGGLISDALGLDAAALIRVAGLSLPFVAYAGVQQALLQRELRFRSRLWPDAGSSAVGAVVTILMAALGGGEWSVIVGLLVTSVSQPLIGLLIGIRIPLRWDLAAALETVRWSTAVGPGAVVGLMVLNVDYIVSARVLGEHETGVYSLAYRIAFVPYVTIPMTLAAVSFSVYSRLTREQDQDAVDSAFAHFLHATAATVGGCYIVLALVADRVTVLSQEWADAGPVLAALCLYGVMLSIELTCYSALRALGRTGYYVAGQAVHLLLLLLLLPVFARLAGIMGIAWVQVAVATVVALGALLSLARFGVTGPREVVRATARPVAACAVTAAGGLCLRQLPWLDDTSALVPGLVFGSTVAALYVGALWALDRHRLREGLTQLRG